jgi:hypothetical protein
MKKKLCLLFVVFFAVMCGNAVAQEFGFGFDDEASSTDASAFTDAAAGKSARVKIGGEIAVELSLYVHSFGKREPTVPSAISFWDMASGRLNFTVSGTSVDAFANFNLNADAISELWNPSSKLGDPAYTPLIIDEAFLRAYIGPVNIEAGLRKLAWGKADALGPLDVTNPLDYTDLRNMADIQAVKIARPMVHLTWNTGGFSKLEAVFIPNFAGHRFATEGRWMPDIFSTIEKGIFMKAGELYGSTMGSNPMIDEVFYAAKNSLLSHFENVSFPFPGTAGLEYFQTGVRYSTTIGSADIGGQYYYGNLFRPSITVDRVDIYLNNLVGENLPLFLNPPDPFIPYAGNPDLLSPQIKYNRYHQIGIDYAQVFFGFNVRSEFAFHLTEDFSGDDGSVRNPFIGWSLGFDRDIAWGVNANVQCNETVRL